MDTQHNRPEIKCQANTPAPADLFRWRVWYARRGLPTTPANAARKKPSLAGWREKATGDPRKIHAEHNSGVFERENVTATGLLTPAGADFGRVIVDDDGGLERLEEHLGVTLRGTTREITTPSGGRQLHFLWPRKAGEFTFTVGKNVHDGFEDVDIRTLGLLPPSPGYGFGNELQTTQAPPELVEWVKSRAERSKARETPQKPSLRSEAPTAPAAARGERHVALMSEAGRLNDGTRDLDGLTARLHEVNAGYYPPIGSPGDDDAAADVDSIARWALSLPPCTPGRPPELAALVARRGQQWYALERAGLAAKGELRYLRMLLAESARTGTVEADGPGVELSDRVAAERLSCTRNTVRSTRERCIRKGLVRYDTARCGERTANGSRSAVTVLLEAPRQDCTTPTDSLSPQREGGGAKSARPGAESLITEHYAHRGPVGYAREDTLALVEAHPGRTGRELGELAGHSRVRDLPRKHLEPLRELGLLVERGGRWYTPDGYAERQRKAHAMEFSTVQARSVRSWDAHAGRWVHFVRETGAVASQAERDAARVKCHADEREAWRRELARRAERARQCRHLSAARACFGGTPVVERDGILADAETGEVLAERRRPVTTS